MISIQKWPDKYDDLEFFAPRQAYMIKKFSAPHELWYLNFYTSKYMTNNKDVFESLFF